MLREDIGKRINSFRKAKKITQKDLGHMIGKSESTIQKYEAGKIDIPLPILQKISDVLGINATDLVDLGAAAIYRDFGNQLADQAQKELARISNEVFRAKGVNHLRRIKEYYETLSSFGIKLSGISMMGENGEEMTAEYKGCQYIISNDDSLLKKIEETQEEILPYQETIKLAQEIIKVAQKSIDKNIDGLVSNFKPAK